MFEEHKEKIRNTLMAKKCRYHKRKFKRSCKICKNAQIKIAVGRAVIKRYEWLERMSP